MQTASYTNRRGELETYFDRTASEAWAKLTSDAPVSGIRATVRAGRDAMRETLLGWLPDDLSGCRVLDAGCGAGQMSIALAQRGAEVVAIDLAETLVGLAQDRTSALDFPGSIDFRVGDMTDPDLGTFDHIVAMDSLIHYGAGDLVAMLETFLPRNNRSVVFTFAPRTPLLSAMHAAGKLFPKSDRSPAIQPIGQASLSQRLMETLGDNWQLGRNRRIKSGFYISHALEVTRA
ncbi:MAG: magnesium protoporphyrin IX methyltransferase [Pseudomonadota bacterium]